MFDVIWTDHDRQLQGEHRAKKEAAAKETSRKQKRSSLSTKRSSVSSDSSPFSSFFRGHGLKRANTSDANSQNSQPVSTTSSRFTSPSPLATSFDGRSPRTSGVEPRPAGAAPGKCSDEQGRAREMGVEDERSVELSRHASIFSKYAESNSVTSHATGDVSLEQMSSSLRKPTAPSHNTPPNCENATWPRVSKKVTLAKTTSQSASLMPGALTPARPKRPSVRPVYLDRWRTPDLWRAPFDMSRTDLQPSIEVLTSMLEDCTTSQPDEVLDVNGWKKEIESKSSVNLDGILLALKSAWKLNQPDEDGDSACSDHGLDELRWMLWSLKYLDPRPERDTSPAHELQPVTAEEKKTLILYECQEIATYLAATNPHHEVHHVSTHQTATAPTCSDTIKTFTVDSLNPNDFPSLSDYSTIMSLTLPSLLPAVDIPPLLARVNQSLAMGGSFNLLLIDSMPRAGTLGRHMRAWLRTYLLPNVERSFRCQNPATLFPEWLASASLRGKGSTITTTKFFANPDRIQIEASLSLSEGADAPASDDYRTRIKKAQIRSLTGRTLWQLIWGGFVSKEATKWWDDPFCQKECIELGTIWEYHFIEGVKDAEVSSPEA